MKITLIKPPAYSAGLMGAQIVPFLGIAYIAAKAREKGHMVDIIDMCGEDIDHTEIIQSRYVKYGMPLNNLDKRIEYTQVIGFSCMFSQDWVFHRSLITYVRKLYPKSIIIAGGEQITALPEFCLKDCPALDICVLGEGEDTIIKLLHSLEEKDGFSEIPGIVYRESSGKIHHQTRRAERIKDIDRLPHPAWDLTPMDNYLSRGLNYHIQRGRTIPMLATRGCPYQCTFCSNTQMWGSPWVTRDAKLVVDEMEEYICRYQANNFVFSDLTAVVTKESIINLCNEILKRGLKITWQLPTLRTESLDRQTLEYMYKAGCRDIDFAIESGSKEVLNTVNKKNDPQKMVSLIKDGLSAGMNMSVNIVLGLPKEGIKDFFKTYFLVMRLAFAGLQEINVFPFIPYPGSKLFQEYLQARKIELNDNYFFGLFGYADLGRAVSWSPHFGPKTLRFLRLFLFINFYGFMFLSHPTRLFLLVKNIIKNKPRSKLEGVLNRIFKNIRAYFSKSKNYAKENIQITTKS